MSDDERKRRFPIPRPGVLLAAAIVLVVIAVGLSVWVPYHREQVVLREIERFGGRVYAVLGDPDWLRDLTGHEWRMKCLDHVTGVYFKDSPVSDNDLKKLAGLTFVSELSLCRTQVSDNGLKHLSEFSRLQRVWFLGTQISDDGLKHLSGLSNLRVFSLKRTQVGDDGLKHLSSLIRLRSLALNGTQVSDGGLKHLSGLNRMGTLYLEGTQVTNEGVESLKKKLPHCKIKR